MACHELIALRQSNHRKNDETFRVVLNNEEEDRAGERKTGKD